MTQPWTRAHVLDLDDWSAGEITHVLDQADVPLRRSRGYSAMRGRTVALLFSEPSTRTYSSFELAAKRLGAIVIAPPWPKAESLLDTARTYRALGAHILVIRHPDAGAPAEVATMLEAEQRGGHVINAGDGCHAHPTQSLGDIYTLHQHWGSLADKRVLIVGDVRHSRVARSAIWGLRHLGVPIQICAPTALLPVGHDAKEWCYGTTNLDAALTEADAIMALRLQRERWARDYIPEVGEYHAAYGLTAARLARAKPGVVVLHPQPMQLGVEITAEVAYGPQSLIQQQVTNGLAVRMALLYLLAGRGK